MVRAGSLVVIVDFVEVVFGVGVAVEVAVEVVVAAEVGVGVGVDADDDVVVVVVVGAVALELRIVAQLVLSSGLKPAAAVVALQTPLDLKMHLRNLLMEGC